YPCYLVGHLLQGGSVMILGGSKQGYRWLNLGIQVAQNRNIIQQVARFNRHAQSCRPRQDSFPAFEGRAPAAL
ncbi:MAG: hypothetical protein LHW41_07180, partial [Candidatus Cloacimonetes bacterium]|nr:hypothetical protein [Candidatus Cloacimonadota bacterium]